MSPVALTIAGSDSGGGAGIQADLKTFSALKVYGASVITAVTAQNTQGVQAIHDVPPMIIAAQLESVFTDLRIDAVKIGMLSQVAVIETVAKALRHYRPSFVVLDPVMVATSGDRLLVPEAVAAMKTLLFPLATLITPNRPEADVLLEGTGFSAAKRDHSRAADAEFADNEANAEMTALLDLGAEAVLLKGGHDQGALSVDILAQKGIHAPVFSQFSAPRHQTLNTHGTGCTLSAAITAYLALGIALQDAVQLAKIYVTSAILAADRLEIGQKPHTGHGPTHHFHEYW